MATAWCLSHWHVLKGTTPFSKQANRIYLLLKLHPFPFPPLSPAHFPKMAVTRSASSLKVALPSCRGCHPSSQPRCPFITWILSYTHALSLLAYFPMFWGTWEHSALSLPPYSQQEVWQGLPQALSLPGTTLIIFTQLLLHLLWQEESREGFTVSQVPDEKWGASSLYSQMPQNLSEHLQLYCSPLGQIAFSKDNYVLGHTSQLKCSIYNGTLTFLSLSGQVGLCPFPFKPGQDFVTISTSRVW